MKEKKRSEHVKELKVSKTVPIIRRGGLCQVLVALSVYEWMNEWMNECIYIPHISHIVSRRFTILIEWDRTSACKGASGCCYQFLFDLTHPPNPCMKCRMKLQIDHHAGNYVPYSFRQVCGFFNVPCWPCNTEDAEDGIRDVRLWLEFRRVLFRSFRQVCGFFNVPCWPCNTEDAGDGAYGL